MRLAFFPVFPLFLAVLRTLLPAGGLARGAGRRRLTAWLAAGAILMASLAPAISSAMAAAQAGSTSHVAAQIVADADICSVAGAGTRADKAPSGHPDAGHFEHCPYCSLHADSPALPPSPAAPLFDALRAHHVPPLFLASAHPLFSWRSAQPRAPPCSLSH